MTMAALSLHDFEARARRFLPHPLFTYVASATEESLSLAQNSAAFARYALVPQVLVDVSRRQQQVELFGHRYDSPFGVAPMGLAAVIAYRGDLALAAAARAQALPMIVSGSSLIRLEDIVQHNPEAWFQAYLPGDMAAIEALLDRVARAGYRQLVITVDAQVAANRENNLRAGFSAPLRPGVSLAWQGLRHPRWLLSVFARTLLRHGMPHFENNYAARGAPIVSRHVMRDFSDRGHLGWTHFAQIRRWWPHDLIVKGVLHAHDASRAVAEGADGLIVSNHGGRQLDGAAAPLQVLPAIVQACPDVPVMLDGGVRRGTDVIKALALGARCVFVGRPLLYAAAVGGQAGVEHAMRLLREEISRNCALLGVRHLGELDAQRHLLSQ